MGKKRNTNAHREKALKRAKEQFGLALELDEQYIKPRYQRMTVLKEEEEYEEALADAKKIEQYEPGFRGIGHTVRELEQL
mmetsp:Transcript_29766/g.39596  ORF Transcript_29766/g.39596 Transcript_29766/m.39596 type:complete len:80 (+) Transcript_29766:288-527(+)